MVERLVAAALPRLARPSRKHGQPRRLSGVAIGDFPDCRPGFVTPGTPGYDQPDQMTGIAADDEENRPRSVSPLAPEDGELACSCVALHACCFQQPERLLESLAEEYLQ